MEPHNPDPHAERRAHPRLRAIYHDANALIDHFFRHRHEWAGSSINYVAQRVIHEHYPTLSAEDVLLLVSAIERVHRAMGDEEAQMDEIVTHFTHHAVV